MSIFMLLLFLGTPNPTMRKFYCLMMIFCWAINKLTDKEFLKIKLKDKCSEE